MATSRLNLRRGVGRLTGDLLLLTATQAGTTTSLVDEVKLGFADNSLIGREAYVASGTAGNVGLIRRVTGNSKSAKTITFLALSAATAIGDVVEVYRESDQGPTIDEIHEAINRAIDSVADVALTEVVSSTSTFSATTGTVAIGATWRFLSGVDWQGTDDLWRPVPPADIRVDAPNRTVELRNVSRWNANTNLVRLRGYTPAEALDSDDDTTVADQEYVVYQAAAQTLLGAAHRMFDAPGAERRAGFFQTIADGRRAKCQTRFHGKVWRLP